MPSRLGARDPPVLAAVGPLSTVLRSPPPSFAPEGRGLRAHIKAQPGLAGPRIVAPPMMAPGFPRVMSPKTDGRSTTWALGNRTPVEGVSRR
jgi:hypothetical protein